MRPDRGQGFGQPGIGADPVCRNVIRVALLHRAPRLPGAFWDSESSTSGTSSAATVLASQPISRR